MLCPNCKTPLAISERSRIEIDYCPTCRGVWLDRGEHDKLIEASSAQMPAQPPAGGSPFFAGEGGSRFRRDDDDDDDDYKRGWGYGRGHPKHKRKSFLSELFDFG
jgi:Zn-finger nucleic acid-binding protein